jgi:hypothetical protein
MCLDVVLIYNSKKDDLILYMVANVRSHHSNASYLYMVSSMILFDNVLYRRYDIRNDAGSCGVSHGTSYVP